MTDDEKQILKVGADAAIKPFSNLIEKLFGGCAEELGGMWQDALQVRRFNRRLKLYKRTMEMIEKAGFEPRQIPDKIWVPVLQAASLEDDEALQDRWAALLANAANPIRDALIHPCFSDILSQLTGPEAVLLEAMADSVLAQLMKTCHEDICPSAFMDEAKLGSFTDLCRLYVDVGLIPASDVRYLGPNNDYPNFEGWSQKSLFVTTLDNLMRLSLIENYPTLEGKKFATLEDGEYRMTALGFEFVSACRAPKTA